MIDVGLLGAGPWATRFWAPALEAAEGARLASVWARRPEAARAVVGDGAARVAASVEELLERCDAVAFAVPPDVQAPLATRAARAGRHVLLEKPLALDVAAAGELAAAVEQAGVASVVGLRHRFDPDLRRLAAWAGAAGPRGAQLRWVSGSALEGHEHATPWRVRHGALLDLGPHALDVLEMVLGPLEEVTARGDPTRWVSVTTRHAGGAVGQAALSLTVAEPPEPERLEVVSDAGTRTWVGPGLPPAEGGRLVVEELLARVAGRRREPGLDAAHGLRLQRLLAAAGTSPDRPSPRLGVLAAPMAPAPAR